MATDSNYTPMLDFWRSNVGVNLPDGVTDTLDSISHRGDVTLFTNNPITRVPPAGFTNHYLTLDNTNNNLDRGQMMFGDSPMRYFTTRDLPVVVNDYVDLFNFATGPTTHHHRLGISAGNIGFSVAKSYEIAANFNATVGAWQVAQPERDGGPFAGNDYELLINVANDVLQYRVRRTSGAVNGTLRITLESFIGRAEPFTELVTTGTDATVYPAYKGSLNTNFPRKFRVVQALAVGNNTITHSLALTNTATLTEVRDNVTGGLITASVVSETANTVVVNVGGSVAAARITILG